LRTSCHLLHIPASETGGDNSCARKQVTVAVLENRNFSNGNCLRLRALPSNMVYYSMQLVSFYEDDKLLFLPRYFKILRYYFLQVLCANNVQQKTNSYERNKSDNFMLLMKKI
jgi:hypothetical protein